MEERDKKRKEEDEAAAGSSRRICVKLKIPKIHIHSTEEEVEMEEGGFRPPPAVVEEVKRFKCKECPKCFSSGKALGGHMSSAHVQANNYNKDHHYSKKLNQKMKRGLASAIKCRLCGRGFVSKKSLFGHMRCHPERQWRGMEPPPPPEEEEEEDSESEENNNPGGVGDIGCNLKGWATKRGRRPVSIPPPHHPRVVSPEENDTLVAGQQLMRLLNGNGNGKAKIGELVEDKMEEEEKEYKGNDKDKMLAADQSRESNSLNDDDHIDIGNCIEEGLLEGAIGVLMSGGDDKQEPPPPNLKENFICSICNRSFLTHQALGGHRSSHNKFNMDINDLVDRHKPPVAAAAAIEDEDEEEEEEEEEENETALNIEQNGGSSIRRSEERFVVDFDLNMTPPHDDNNHDDPNAVVGCSW